MRVVVGSPVSARGQHCNIVGTWNENIVCRSALSSLALSTVSTVAFRPISVKTHHVPFHMVVPTCGCASPVPLLHRDWLLFCWRVSLLSCLASLCEKVIIWFEKDAFSITTEDTVDRQSQTTKALELVESAVKLEQCWLFCCTSILNSEPLVYLWLSCTVTIWKPFLLRRMSLYVIYNVLGSYRSSAFGPMCSKCKF